MILAGFLIGMTLSGLALMLIRVEDTGDKFGSAVAMFSGWCAFGMLMMAGTYGLGLLIPGLTGAAVLVLRTTNLGEQLSSLASYKMPLGVGALVASVLTWVGVLNLMEGYPNG